MKRVEFGGDILTGIKRKYILTPLTALFVAFVGFVGFESVAPLVRTLMMTSSYVGTIKANWGVTLPNPAHTTTIMNTRGGIQGDGDAITELVYSNQTDIRQIKSLSTSWEDGKTFATEERSFPLQIKKVIKPVDAQAEYLYISKPSLSNYVVFELKGHTLTVYESYL